MRHTSRAVPTFGTANAKKKCTRLRVAVTVSVEVTQTQFLFILWYGLWLCMFHKCTNCMKQSMIG